MAKVWIAWQKNDASLPVIDPVTRAIEVQFSSFYNVGYVEGSMPAGYMQGIDLQILAIRRRTGELTVTGHKIFTDFHKLITII